MKSSIVRTLAGLAFVFALASVSSTAQAQDWAKEKLDKSPRHREWVKVKHDDREVNCYVAYPEVKDKAHGRAGDSRNLRSDGLGACLTDQLAEAGYIAIAPDLLSGKGPDGEGPGECPRAAATRRDRPNDSIVAARSDHGRLECRGRIRNEAPFVQR